MRFQEVSFDETKTLVRPNFKLSRNTIILRDLSDATEQQGMGREREGISP
jgi:hypothetical protein